MSLECEEAMDFKLFSDLVDAAGKLAALLKGAAQLPANQREQIRVKAGETFTVLDTTLSMLIIRLGDILLRNDDADFTNEVMSLDNYHEWLEAERRFRLCEALRAARREIGTMGGLLQAASVNNFRALTASMDAILTGENELAAFVSVAFHELAESARQYGADVPALRKDLARFRQLLLDSRSQLIKDEAELYSII